MSGSHYESEIVLPMATSGMQVFGKASTADGGEDDVDIIAMQMIPCPYVSKGQRIQQAISNLGMNINACKIKSGCI